MSEQKQNADTISDTNGFIEWRVEGDLLKKFKSASHDTVFHSPRFKTTDGTIWRIKFYPYGCESRKHCDIYLQCMTLNGTKQRIGANYSFNILSNWVGIITV
eukprot:387091_1